jgi:hypothetical protein
LTSTNHVMTGAVIALVVKQPALAIPLAFASHFVLDAMPHYGIYENDVIRRNKHWLFRTVLSIDVPLMLFLLVVIPGLAAPKLAWGVVLACMLAAILPDATVVYRFLKQVKTQKWEPPGNWFTRFHLGIQWYEHPPGLIVELAWFVAMTVVFDKLLA